jgi:hypothetical protein
MRRVAITVLVLAGVISSSAAAADSIETAIYLTPERVDAEARLSFQRTRAAGATVTRLPLIWSSVAPERRPAGFRPSDHEDPAYRWDSFDSVVAEAVRSSLQPLVTVHVAPRWAEDAGTVGPAGTRRPAPHELASFVRAAATRYSGEVPSLPRVHLWQVWNEPNVYLYISPQRVDRKPFSPQWYRQMLNAAARAIHSVHRDNVVIAGGLAPFTTRLRKHGVGPLEFMREMLCLSRRLKRTCKQRSHFDIWAHHPYTSGGPTHQAYRADDVSLGDLPEMRRVLMAAYRNGSIVSRTAPKFWVTEFSWDTRPPDPRGVPVGLHTRWVAEGLYRMWQSGVSLVTWLQLRDGPIATSFFQGGLYFRGASIEQDRPKPALRAFRFPLVAFPRRGGVYVWGRTPASEPGKVVVEQSFRGGWRRLGVLRTSRHGIFQRRFSSAPVGSVRARMLGTSHKAVPFSLKHVPDRFFNPFGSPTLVEPRRKPRP